MPLGNSNSFGKARKTTTKNRRIFNRTGEQWQLANVNWNIEDKNWDEI